MERKSMKNWSIQELETKKQGYENWNTYCIRAENNVHIASVGHVDRFFEEDTLAHAKLISAAPDLLEACMGLANITSIDPNDYPDMGAYRQTRAKLDKAIKAIAKATE
jgi:hypothetical protein